jgi:hypothetical protein
MVARCALDPLLDLGCLYLNGQATVAADQVMVMLRLRTHPVARFA